MADSAVVFTNGLLNTLFAKTCHGLLRGTERFDVIGVIDARFAGQDSGLVMDNHKNNVLVYDSIQSFIKQTGKTTKYCIVGVAFPGGYLPDECRPELRNAIRYGMSLVCGLHHLLSEDTEFRDLADAHGVELIDIRKPKPTGELHFWSGEILDVKAPKIAVLGTDCAVGKRTTCRMLMQACNSVGIRTEMIYTGQTGWMQGSPYGIILDAIPNDFVSGELEHAIVHCANESNPDLILIEGQSSLRNPSGPCGAELILSANSRHVVLQHAPGRRHFVDLEDIDCRIPTLEDEIALVQAYGARVLAVGLNEEKLEPSAALAYQEDLRKTLGIQVLRPLHDRMRPLIPEIKKLFNGNNADLF